MADAKTLLRNLIGQLSFLHGQTFKNVKTSKDLQQAIYNLGQLINSYKRELARAVKASSISDLVKLSDYLDENGFHLLADKVDSVIESLPYKQASSNEIIKTADFFDNHGLEDLADIIESNALIICRASDYGFFPKQRCIEEGETPPVQLPCNGSLSTRYCPDHKGVQAIRLGDHEYQCPIDGKKYDYESGYLNYDGQVVPGGSIAAQTPTTSDYGGIPMRIYDSRSDVLNRLN
jgi:hypothetical protein